ncbi:unnamed protein product [Darwinula stevensoni]|uniref:Uncharacterized protein n=1 Tax=Darwinula stevensoni TaxID=69355 RepID=A0A7R9AF25_9CRUS|nr:unnamed protein product [Darwinula stevensoni]CAG0902203.1 unnamed protein product [Darwinula stevensoni]
MKFFSRSIALLLGVVGGIDEGRFQKHRVKQRIKIPLQSVTGTPHVLPRMWCAMKCVKVDTCVEFSVEPTGNAGEFECRMGDMRSLKEAAPDSDFFAIYPDGSSFFFSDTDWSNADCTNYEARCSAGGGRVFSPNPASRLYLFESLMKKIKYPALYGSCPASTGECHVFIGMKYAGIPDTYRFPDGSTADVAELATWGRNGLANANNDPNHVQYYHHNGDYVSEFWLMWCLRPSAVLCEFPYP